MYPFITVMPDGTVVASEPNPAVDAALLKEILLWKLEGCSNDDVITRLRQRTVPEGYIIHPWITCTLICRNFCQESH